VNSGHGTPVEKQPTARCNNSFMLLPE